VGDNAVKKPKLKLKIPKFSINPFVRISIGLVCLTLCLVLTGDLLLGLTSDERRALLDQRKKICETLAVQFSALAEGGEVDTIHRSMKALVQGNEDVMSTAMRDAEGNLLTSAGDHDKYWDKPSGDSSTPTHAQVPIFSGDNRWGTVEVAFYKKESTGLLGLVSDPLIRFLLFLTATGLLSYTFFMKKTLKHLDPKAVIPDRVRSALDLLAEGIVMIDQKHDIVLANAAFAQKIGKDANQLLGQSLTKMRWHANDEKGRKVKEKDLPWIKAMKQGDTQTECVVALKSDEDEMRVFSINSSPIMDGGGSMRGAMATFNDETALQQANSVLVDMMDKLRKSQEQMTVQNAELQRLATQDPLTDCLNRRSFFEQIGPVFTKARSDGGALACIMTDIDRFKSINDTYGHAVGDQVIEAVAKVLQSTFGEKNMICRYGGEEFCMVMPGAELGEAVKAAETARQAIEKSLSDQLKVKPELAVSASFGVASITHGAADINELIHQADKALYLAKQSGRNKVSRWDQVQDDMAA
jgi:diguanylate cyclase (GGDEF)-like protein/PAS domain S-box-containing protein